MGFLKKYIEAPPLQLVGPSEPSIVCVPSEPELVPFRPVIPDNQPKPLPKKDPRIVAIEAEAYALGWKPEQLWKNGRWYNDKGLAYIIRADQIITEVTNRWIRLEHTEINGKKVVQRFYNMPLIKRLGFGSLT